MKYKLKNTIKKEEYKPNMIDILCSECGIKIGEYDKETLAFEKRLDNFNLCGDCGIEICKDCTIYEDKEDFFAFDGCKKCAEYRKNWNNHLI